VIRTWGVDELCPGPRLEKWRRPEWERVIPVQTSRQTTPWPVLGAAHQAQRERLTFDRTGRVHQGVGVCERDDLCDAGSSRMGIFDPHQAVSERLWVCWTHDQVPTGRQHAIRHKRKWRRRKGVAESPLCLAIIGRGAAPRSLRGCHVGDMEERHGAWRAVMVGHGVRITSKGGA